ncbi:MAG: outer membrane lipoprotein carrier protein LolA [Muribaculaceae bacterium]|nr:outer membrane lipoprotein carrier protein LolA [Muribaculaceae bacterium]
MKKFLLGLAILVVYGSAGAQSFNQQEVKQTIGIAASRIKTMKCDFVQTKHVKLLNDKVVSKGKMCFQQTDKLRWEYTEPYSYAFILNGSKVLLKNNRRNDVIDVNRNKLFKEIARIMMSSVAGNCLTDTKSFKTSIADSPTEWIATLIPQRKELKQMFQKILIHFNKQKATVAKVELIEKNGDNTLIELKNTETNATIAPNTFNIN